MGGEGSGRKPSVETMIAGLTPPRLNPIIPTTTPEMMLPNYSGVRGSALKSSTLTNGSVIFVGSDLNFAQDNANFFWDDTNNRLGIGTTTPSQKLSVSGGSIIVTGGGSLLVDTNGTSLTIGTGSNTAAAVAVSGSRAYFGYDGGNAVVQGVAAKGIKFNVNNGTFGSGTAMTIDTAGNVGIGTTAPDKALEINLGTTNAFRLCYNDNNGTATTYMDTTLSSVGLTTFTAAGSAPAFAFSSTVRLKNYTVATLPAGTQGDVAYVTDQLTSAAAKGVAPTGGGAVNCVVFYNGAAWVGI